MLPLHIIDELAKPTTHAARLWANIFAGEVLILILAEGAKYITWLPLGAWLGFSLFVGAIQAYIFTVLAMVYISQKIADEH
jgi:F-type H+-transporting ATPase subunit a